LSEGELQRRRSLRQNRGVPTIEPAYAVIVHVAEGFSWWQVVGPALAAAAAGASWSSVFLSRRGQNEAKRPQLVFYVEPIKTEDEADAPGPLAVRIENVGQGVALMPGFFILSGQANGQAASSLIPISMNYGEKVRYGLPFVTIEGAFGVAYCEDRNNNVHIWTNKGQYKRYRPRQRKGEPITVRRLLDDLGSGINVDSIHLLPVKRLS
jgi:hypothetical protein